MSKWASMENAPKSSDLIDLWVIDKEIRRDGSVTTFGGRRIADAMWSAKDGGWVSTAGLIERAYSGGRTIATHWMFPAKPPTE